MMKWNRLAACVLLVASAGAGCQGTTVPERRELLGSWQSSGFADATIVMTLAETARSVDGAGAWITPTEGHAFSVSGALAMDEVSLHFDFADRPSVNFQGFFTAADVIEGFLTGGGLRRQPITLTRQDLTP